MREDSFDETENVISATECTGLLPALPVNDPEGDENTARLYAIHAPKRRNGKRCEGKERVRRS